MTAKPSPILWISHRGLTQTHMENTQGSFDAALACGFTCLETDLRTTRDGHLVLSHDGDLSRLGGPPTPISTMSREDFAAVRLGDGSRPLFFDEFIALYAAYRWTFDIKPEGGFATVKAFAAFCEKNQSWDWMRSQAKFLFWDKHQEAQFFQLFPQANLYARKSQCLRAGIFSFVGLAALAGIEGGRTYGLSPRLWGIRLFRPTLVARYHRLGAKVCAYLPVTEEEIAAAKQAGFDEILTDGRVLA